MVFDVDLYRNVYCTDCKKYFLVSGSAPAVNTKCTHCGSKNFEIQIVNPNTKKNDKG